MSDVDRLFKDFVAAHRSAAGADPIEFLTQAPSQAERDELVELIDGFLARAPRRRWSAGAFPGTSAERVADDLEHTLVVSSAWTVALPRLRERAQITRAKLVSRLAVALAVGGREAKVHDYYHQMEQGSLDPAGVSDRVLDALAEIVGTTRDALRKSGGVGGDARAAGGAVFARTALPAPELATGAPPAGGGPATARDEWDEVDELFRGGGRQISR